MSPHEPSLDARSWGLLILLSVLWGASFFFVGIALRELPPLTIVLARLTLAALIMLPIALWMNESLPRNVQEWLPFAGMALFNNVVPHSLIAYGQTLVSSGLAAVLNATTPLFTLLIMAAAGDERLTRSRVAGIALGVIGVAVLRGADAGDDRDHTLGIALCLAAAGSYGVAGLWGRRMLGGVSPVTSATGQLIAGAAMLAVLTCLFDRPWSLALPGIATVAALVGFAVLSTAVAYVVFFELLARAGATNVMLVTLLIPVTAILLGYFFLQEMIGARHITGALLIGGALLTVDGRILRRRL